MKKNVIHRYLSSRVLPIWTILLFDVLIIVLSCLMAYALRYDFRSIFLETSTIDRTIIWTILANLICFRIFKTYSNVLRFSSFVDIMRIFVSLSAAFTLLIVGSFILENFFSVIVAPISVLFMGYIKPHTEKCRDMLRILKEKTGCNIEVLVYGDGAFKDPVGKIWELADPVVSPAYTKGLVGTPNEIKLKYVSDNEFASLNGEELKEKIKETIVQKEQDLKGKMITEGTTPRRYIDLIGSLCDLTSGSGDKGTPVVYIQGYFDNLASE